MNTHVCVVKTTNRVVLQPSESKTITGFARKLHAVESAVTEPSEGVTSRVTVCTRVVALNTPVTSSRIPVKVFNMSAKPVTTPSHQFVN